MTLSAYFTSKSVFDQQGQGCRALTFALARLSCSISLQFQWYKYFRFRQGYCRFCAPERHFSHQPLVSPKFFHVPLTFGLRRAKVLG